MTQQHLASDDDTTPMRPARVAVVLSVLAVLAAVAAGVAFAMPALDPPVRFSWVVAALLLVLAELRTLEFRAGPDVMNVSLSELPMLMAVTLLPLPEVLAATAIASLLTIGVIRHSPPLKILANLTVTLLAMTSMSVVVLGGLQGRAPSDLRAWGVLLLGALVASTVAHVSLVFILHAVGISSEPRDRWRALGAGCATAVGTASVAIVTIEILWTRSPMGLPALAVCVMTAGAYRAYTRLRRSHENLQVLNGFTRASLAARDTVGIASHLLSQIRDVLRCEHVDIVLYNSLDEQVLRIRDSADGVRYVSDLPRPTASSHAWARQQARGKPALYLGRHVSVDLSSFMAEVEVTEAMVAPMPLSAMHGMSGLIIATNQLGQASKLDGDGLELLTSLVAHATVALENGQLIDRLQHDASERERAALHDPLTGLPNRNMLVGCIESTITASPKGRHAVLLVDLDRFKDINDTLGHEVGDRVLREVGRRIQEVLRDDDVVAHLGGDEFAVLSADLHCISVTDVLVARISDALAVPYRVEQQDVVLRGSIGVALSPDHGTDARHLLRSADVAMYRAKEAGTGHRLYSAEDDNLTSRRVTLAADLREAILQRHVQVHFQPKIDIRTGQIAGAEALARWTHPIEGFIPPDQFVAMAEAHGLIDELTTLVIEESLNHAGAWMLAGHPIGVAVNLSPLTVVDPTFPDHLSRLLESALVDPATLTLEITESSMLSDPNLAVVVLNRLSQLGVKVSIDDFGTGFSSLSYLKRLPASEVKIDRAFVGTMTSDASDEVIVRSVVDLGHNLGMQVVAEGVEDRETCAALALLGCDIGQGYGFSRPVPGQEFMRLLRSGELAAQSLLLTDIQL